MEADHGNGPISVSVINIKGGVGKSTIAVLLARYASGRGRKVLAIDMDPQANLSQAFMWNGYKKFLEDKRPSIVEVFREYRPPSPGIGSPSRLDPADVVVDVGPNLQLIPSRFDFSDNLVGGIKPDPLVLARFLSANFGDRDLIFIDCAPTESIFTVAAYGASRYVLVPVKPEYFATIGFPLLRESLENYRSRTAATESMSSASSSTTPSTTAATEADPRRAGPCVKSRRRRARTSGTCSATSCLIPADSRR